jgi:hypothetical protein
MALLSHSCKYSALISEYVNSLHPSRRMTRPVIDDEPAEPERPEDDERDEAQQASEPLDIERFLEIKDLFKRGSSSKDISSKLGIPLKEVNAVLPFSKYSRYLTHRDR